MRSDFLMALLVCGTRVVAIPPLSDQKLNTDLIDLRSTPGPTQVMLRRMSEEYRFGCYVLGVGMIVTSVIAAAVSGRRSEDLARATEATYGDLTESAAGRTEVRETASV